MPRSSTPPRAGLGVGVRVGAGVTGLVVTVGAGAGLVPGTVTIQKNPNNGTWRVTFAVKPDGSGRAVELRCFLRKTTHVGSLTETWSYLWNP